MSQHQKLRRLYNSKLHHSKKVEGVVTARNSELKVLKKKVSDAKKAWFLWESSKMSAEEFACVFATCFQLQPPDDFGK